MSPNPNQNFYKSDDGYREQIEKVLKRKTEASEITLDDEKIIRSFLAELRATRGISDVRAAKLVSNITGLRRWTPPFREMTTPDVYQAIDAIHRHGFKQNSEADVVRALKRICTYLCENNLNAPGLDFKKVQKIRPPGYNSATKDHDDLLTPDEVMKLITCAGSVKHQAIISTLYEGGMRIGEIGHLQWNQVKFHETHVAISTDFKTGKKRTIPLYNSMGYLKQWRNESIDNSGDFVFVMSNGKPYSYPGLVKMIRTAAKRAGIDRHITPHIFRHSRITHLIKEGWRESTIKKMMWGSVESDMFKVYLHLCDEDLADEAAERMGIKRPGRPTNESRKLEPIQCLSCGTVNPFTHRFCGGCGAALTRDAAEEVRIFKQMIDQASTMSEDKIIERVMKKLKDAEGI